jgi:hypothetical protein
MKKFENRPETGYFVIDPAHLDAGLKAAVSGNFSSIRISPLDFRTKNLSFDPAEFKGQKWIRKLCLDEELDPVKENMVCLYELASLEELTLNEWAVLDFSKFKKLKGLVLCKGTALTGLNKVKSLKMIYLAQWKNSLLPDTFSSLTADEARIDAAKNLTSIEPLFSMPDLRHLTLKDLPELSMGKTKIILDKLKFLNVERVSWTDFSNLQSKSLAELELFTKFQSLKFIGQLPELKKLYIWECIDGDMNPVLLHPSLKEIYFDKNRKHYTHKEAELQGKLMKG